MWKDDETLLNIVGPTTMEELEEFGYAIVKVDELEKMLSEAQKKGQKAQLEVTKALRDLLDSPSVARQVLPPRRSGERPEE